MRIVVNDIAASEGGALAVLKEFYQAVRKYDTQNEYIFLLSQAYLEETERIKVILQPQVKKSKLRKLLFDFVTGRRLINKLKPDVVFSMQNIVTWGVKSPQILYVHQPLPFQTLKKYSFLKKDEAYYAAVQYLIGHIIRRSVCRAKEVIVQTKWMRKAVVDKTGVSTDKIHVIPPYIEQYSGAIEKAEYSPNNFFYPTSVSIYKNNRLILEAVDILHQEGFSNFSVEMTLNKEESDIENVRYIGRVDRSEVWKRYANSTLLFPSYIETFGMPLAEARQMGTVILAANCDFAHEVLENYKNAYFFDYKDAGQLAELMKKVMRGEINKAEDAASSLSGENSWMHVIKVLTEANRK